LDQQEYNKGTVAEHTAKNLRLLVVDDAPFIREVVRHIVDVNGIELVGEAIDGEEAVEFALRLKPDVILMDIIMPKKNGIEATTEILAKMPNIKVIAFSTANQESLVMRALTAGCCNFLVKPFKSDELLEIIRKSLNQDSR
jgi:two-component system chemotaxis response regulator CheY